MLDENLQYGSTGNDVQILQEKLKILGFYNALITGIFGLSTEVGVKALQKELGLEETGIVDNELWQKILEYTETSYYAYSNEPILSLGATGNDVKNLQIKLKALLYFTGAINSTFDLETETAVKRLQYHNKLTTTGIVNNQTWNVINTLFGNLNSCVTENITEGSFTTYTVVKGDTLYSIASKFNTTVDAIKNLNNLSSNTLSIGQILKIPTSDGSGSTNQPTTSTYTVVRGDTLYSIASKFNTTVDAIKNINNLTSNTLSIGQILKIPTSNGNEGTNQPTITYIVVNGDTLYSIASKFNTTVDAIKNLNNLSSNILSIGQILKIPSTASNQPLTTYTVVRGDTLYSIANKFNTTVDAIKSLNNLSSNTLSIGQNLKIPS